jgi:hypothetical protein
MGTSYFLTRQLIVQNICAVSAFEAWLQSGQCFFYAFEEPGFSQLRTWESCVVCKNGKSKWQIWFELGILKKAFIFGGLENQMKEAAGNMSLASIYSWRKKLLGGWFAVCGLLQGW